MVTSALRVHHENRSIVKIIFCFQVKKTNKQTKKQTEQNKETDVRSVLKVISVLAMEFSGTMEIAYHEHRNGGPD